MAVAMVGFSSTAFNSADVSIVMVSSTYCNDYNHKPVVDDFIN
jgi:hypothetical protein